jgi:hypothetical protein
MDYNRTNQFIKAAIILCAVLASGFAEARPTYSVTEQTLNVDPAGVSCSANPGSCFKVHYVTSSSDAPASTDTSPNNGIPDYIDSVVEALKQTYQREIVELGWQPPPSDSGLASNGGDGRYDVYVTTVSCSGIAFVDDEAAVSAGSNNWVSHMVLGKDMQACYNASFINTGPGDLSTLSEYQVILDVIAHEFHHSIQDGLNDFASGQFKEASSNWMNDEAFDNINANVLSTALGDHILFSDPSVPLNTTSRGGYGGWFWLRYLSERFGHAFVRDIWAQLDTVTNNELTATATELGTRGTTLKDSWVDFSGKLLAKSWFEEGATYPDVAIQNAGSPFSTYPISSSSYSIDHLARSYLKFNPSTSSSSLLQIQINGPNSVDSGATKIEYRADGRRVDNRVTFDSSNDGTTTVSGFSTSPPPTEPAARTSSVVVVLANASTSTDSASFQLCAPNCSIVTGVADPQILPWGAALGNVPPLWQTVDIWVDNDGDCMPAAAGQPGCNEPDDTSTADVDAEPTRGLSNNLYARIRNLGDTAATGVQVRFEYAPFGVALPTRTWALIGTATADLAAAGDSAGNDVKITSVAWDLSDLSFNNAGAWDIPSTSTVETLADFTHFCVRVTLSFTGDGNTDNNLAQNNFGDIPATASGRTMRFIIGNPFEESHAGRFRFAGKLPEGWSVEFPGLDLDKNIQLKPGEIRWVEAKLKRPATTVHLAKDVLVDLSLEYDGKKAGGISVRLASSGDSPNPVLPDTDNDGVIDADEPYGDADKDGKPNVNDPDSDNDGIKDGDDPKPWVKDNGGNNWWWLLLILLLVLILVLILWLTKKPK